MSIFFLFKSITADKPNRTRNRVKSACDFVSVINNGVLDCCQTLSDTHHCLHGAVLYATLTEILPAWC